MKASQTAIDEFGQSWALSNGDDFASALQRQSLEAFAAQVPSYAGVLDALKARGQTRLELHVEGKSIVEHQANAEAFARLVRGIAEATKEVAKARLRMQRRASTLLISAVAPGSVQVIFQASAGPRLLQDTFPSSWTPTVDSAALDAVASIIARAGAVEALDSDDVLSGLAADLPARAHPGLRRVAKAITGEGWFVRGELRTRGEVQPFEVTAAGARGLLRALSEQYEEHDEMTLHGVVDGQRRSIGALWFAPDGAAPIEAAVPSSELLEQVIRLDADRARAIATFDVITIIGRGVESRPRSIYTLREISQEGGVTLFE